MLRLREVHPYGSVPIMRRLPPLGAIEAFVQVARLGSIKAAAEELALSAPALSRRVQSLERFIGKPLFARRHQAMALNEDGDRLLAGLAPVLDALSDAVEGMTSGPEVLRVRLGTLPLFASQRLFPHMAELRAAHPELHLDIDTAGHFLSRLGDGLDAALVLARPKFAARLPPEAREAFIARLVAATEVVDQAERVAECRDPGDDMVLEAALAAGAAVVVSDDRDLLVLDPWRGVRVLKPEAALALLGEGLG